MNSEQGKDYLVLTASSKIENILIGIGAILFGVLGLATLNFDRSLPSPLLRQLLMGGLISIMMVGAVCFFIQPTLFTFDRLAGELTILRRWRRKENRFVYQLSAFKTIFVVAHITGYSEPDSTVYAVELLMDPCEIGTNQTAAGERLVVWTGAEARLVAEQLTAFLDLPVQYETR